MTVHVDVDRACDCAGALDNDAIVRCIHTAVSHADGPSNAEVAVRIVDRDEIHRLNSDFRQRDAATNVLSFPAGTIEGLPINERLPLGDIVICAAVIASEAEEQGKREADHWAHMLVHGTLHLLGFDHESDADANKMESLETRILRVLAVPDPYEESHRET